MMQCTNPKLQFCLCQRKVSHLPLFCTLHGCEPRNVWIVPRRVPWSLLLWLAALECDEGVVSASMFMSCCSYRTTRLSSLTRTKWSCPSYLVWSIWSLECAWVLSIMCKYTVMEQKFAVFPVCAMWAYKRYRGTDRQRHWFVISAVRGGECSAALHRHFSGECSAALRRHFSGECSAALHRHFSGECSTALHRHFSGECSAALHCHFSLVTCWIGGWMRPGMCLDIMEQIKISAPAGNWNLHCPACSLVTVVTELFWFQVSVFEQMQEQN